MITSSAMRLCLSVLAVLAFFQCLQWSSAASYSIDSSPGLSRRFDGIGALSAGASSRLLPDYREPYRSEILDYLFLPRFGASLQILKVEIGGDAQSTEGTEPSHQHSQDDENYQRGYEWWLMKEAKARNPDIKLFGLSWSTDISGNDRGFPGWVTSDPSHPLTNATADYTVRWLLAARRLHNLTIDYIGIWNERDFSRDYILALRDRLTASQLSTVIVAADGWYGICDSMTGDTELQSAIAYIGLHYPSESTTAACAALPQPTWASEDFSSYYQAGGCWSRLLNRNYVYANLTAAISWSPIASYYDELPYSGVGLMLASSPWSGHYAVDQALWVTAHTTHFADIGWRYLEHGSGVGRLQGGGTYVSLTDGQGGLTVIVEAMGPDVSYCINEGPQSPNVTKQQVVFTLAGDFASITQLFAFYSSFDPTRPIVQFQYAGVVDVADGSFSFTLLPDAMFTFSTRNASKGAHPTPPSPSAFPLPHSDSFDHYALYSEARYLIDQSGSFEIVEAADSSRGRVMRQSVTAAPAVWCDEAPYPFSIIGSHSWRAVNASVDVLIESSGMALLAAGVVTGGCMGSAGSVGLTFAISTDGHWLVSNSTSLKPQLAAGQLQVDANTWYRLHVAVTDSGTALSVNGKLLTTLAEWTAASGNGWVAIGSDFSNVQYDRLRITLSREEKETAPQLPQQASHRHVRPVTLI